MRVLYVWFLLVLSNCFVFGTEHLKTSFQSSIGSETTEIDISIDTLLDKAHFVISGPLDKYIGFGFGQGRMTGSYAFACNSDLGDVSERLFTRRDTGLALTPSVENVTRVEDVPNNRVTIEFDRNTTGLNSNYFSFDFEEEIEIDFIYSLGRDKEFKFHGSSNYGITKLQFSEVVTGLSSSKASTRISMFPNPVRDVITLDLSSDHSTVEVKILDAKGTEVLTKTLLPEDGLKLDVSTVKPGFYVLSISTDSFRSGMSFQKL